MMKLSRMRTATLILAALGAGAAQAGMDGHTIGAQYLLPDIGTVNNDHGTAVVGPGVEFFLGDVSQDLSDSQITLSRAVGISFVTAGSFNGWRYYDALGTMPDITGVTVNGSSTFPGFDNSRITFDANNIWLNFANLSNSDFSAVVDVQMGVIPEPSTYALMAVGLLGIALTARRGRPG